MKIKHVPVLGLVQIFGALLNLYLIFTATSTDKVFLNVTICTFMIYGLLQTLFEHLLNLLNDFFADDDDESNEN